MITLRVAWERRLLGAAGLGACIGATAAFLSLSAPRGQVIPTTVLGRPPAVVRVVAKPAINTSIGASPTSGHRQAPDDDVLARARALEAEADVSALVALRNQVDSDTKARGNQDSSSAKDLGRQIEGSLERARALRLKLDGLQLRNREKR